MKQKEIKLYFSKAEYNNFTLMRQIGRISFFRIKICDAIGCKNEVLNNVKYCSKQCYVETEGEEENDNGLLD